MTENTNNHPAIEKTKDGSHTLYSNRFNQHYHNTGGAVSESNHIFFKMNGLTNALNNDIEINILEIGFGTGLNLLQLLDKYFSTGATAQVHYHTIEAYPVSAKTIESLNYRKFLNHPKLFQHLLPVFKALNGGRNEFNIAKDISLSVYYGSFSNYDPEDLSFDYIFHDAFSPKANPELWTDTIFKKLLQCSSDETLLTTYCAASKIRGGMASAGWKIARAPGALRKREMTIASPTEEPIKNYKQVNERHLASRFENDEFS